MELSKEFIATLPEEQQKDLKIKHDAWVVKSSTDTATFKVGKYEPKEVSKLNRVMFIQAKEILENNQHTSHIGWHGLGKFVDFLESHYKIEPLQKTGPILQFDE